MRPANRETRNLFATFSMRSENLRRGGAFLTGTALAVLFALSTPSFAQLDKNKLTIAAIDDVVAGDEGWIIAIDDVAADAGGWITAIDDIFNNGGIAAYGAETDNGGFAAFGDIDDLGGGIAAFGEVEDEIDGVGDVVEIKIDNVLNNENDDDFSATDDDGSTASIEDNFEPFLHYSYAPVIPGNEFFAIGEIVRAHPYCDSFLLFR